VRKKKCCLSWSQCLAILPQRKEGRGETLSCTMMGSLDGVKEGEKKKKKDEDHHDHIPFFVPSFNTLTEQLHDCCQRKKGLCTQQQHNYYGERERDSLVTSVVMGDVRRIRD
jgi:hypothetical protein